MVGEKKDGERLAVLENQMTVVGKKVDALDTSIQSLHTKMDTLVTTFQTNYVSKGEFDEWKKNRNLERILTIIVTTIITASLTYFFRTKGF